MFKNKVVPDSLSNILQDNIKEYEPIDALNWNKTFRKFLFVIAGFLTLYGCYICYGWILADYNKYVISGNLVSFIIGSFLTLLFALPFLCIPLAWVIYNTYPTKIFIEAYGVTIKRAFSKRFFRWDQLKIKKLPYIWNWTSFAWTQGVSFLVLSLPGFYPPVILKKYNEYGGENLIYELELIDKLMAKLPGETENSGSCHS